MAKVNKKKCQVCIGCGRCVNTTDASLQVVTESFLKQRLAFPSTEPFALADIGTTTIAMELYDGNGMKVAEYVRPNPQRIFGADVISRIAAAQNSMNARQMQSLVRKVLQEGLEMFAQRFSKKQEDKATLLTGMLENEATLRTETLESEEKPWPAPAEPIANMYLAANTTMLYLLFGHDTAPLGEAPFRAEYLEAESFDLGDCKVQVLPGLAAFVGADILAGVLACGMQESEAVSLLIDLGTNGELVLGNYEKMYACSTAAGPAFEGMLKAEGQAVWGADIVKCVASLLEEEIMDETGLLKEPYFTEGVSIGGVKLTQEHIRNLQTAKAAIASGIQMLMKQFGIEAEDVQNVYLAGGFGYFLDADAAVKIGLIPEEFRDKTKAVGNSALAGCYAYHADENVAEKITRIKMLTRVINLAEEEGFAETFVGNMNF